VSADAPAIEALAHALTSAKPPALRVLDASGNMGTDDDGAARLTGAVVACPRVECLDIRSSRLSDGVGLRLAQALCPEDPSRVVTQPSRYARPPMMGETEDQWGVAVLTLKRGGGAPDLRVKVEGEDEEWL
jgi:hypothetical protein